MKLHTGTVPGWSLALVLLAASALPGENFRVDTELFLGKEKQPIQETLTIFAEGRVYDFMLVGAKEIEITIFNPGAGSFTILDVEKQTKTSITNQKLLEECLAINKAALADGDSLDASAADPKFEAKSEPFEDNGEDLTRINLTGKRISYEIVGRKAQQPETARLYRQFADWSARLNATRGQLPPGARLAAGKSLEDAGLVPVTIARTITQGGALGKKSEAHCRLIFNSRLSGEDQKRIERAGECVSNYREVKFDEIRFEGVKPQPPKQARR